ncbi:hypothetical protein KJ359_008033 [Pestalotiopsis sp. 9143b]|nr:hypothetical protein KJ359_008033 [Pestalotiopsis sp. 9143b]
MAVETPQLEKPTIDGVPLYVNGGLLSPGEVKPLRPSDPSEPLETLRERYAEDGYVFLKGLLPREDVISARGSYFRRLQPCGVLQPGADPRDGIFNASGGAGAAAEYPGVGVSAGSAAPASANEKLFTELALKAHTDAWYIGSGEKHGLVNHPALLGFVAGFTGWGADTLGIRRTLLRNNTPGNRAIGVHYDQIFLRHGEPSVLTAWVPVGDVALDGGGLIYLEGGDRLGQKLEAECTEKARAAGLDDDEVRNAFNKCMMKSGWLSPDPAAFGREYGRKWLVTAYEAGDVVLHSAHMIHASTVNHDKQGRIRVGTDLRFVDSSRPWDTRWSNHFTFTDGL